MSVIVLPRDLHKIYCSLEGENQGQDANKQTHQYLSPLLMREPQRKKL